jgi:hypothetical protein
MNIEKLPIRFDGKGEVHGFKFIQVCETDRGYVYAVTNDKSCHYECFLFKTVPLCIDFEKKIYSNENRKERYPKSNDFGKWAWTFKDIKSAINKVS